MSRRKDDYDVTGFLVGIIILLPIAIIYGIGKLMILIADSIREKKAMETTITEHSKSPEELSIELNNEIENKLNKTLNILNEGTCLSFDYISYYENKLFFSEYESYTPSERPTIEDIRAEYNVKSPNFILDFLIYNRKKKRLAQEKECQAILEQRLVDYDNMEKERIHNYMILKEEYETKLKNYNADITRRKENYIKYNEEEIENVFKEFILGNSEIANYNITIDTKFNSLTKTMILDYQFPHINYIIPDIKRYEYIKSKNELKEIKFSAKEQKKLYENFIFQLSLKIINISFHFDAERINNIIFNGKIYSLDPTTGKNAYFNILSLNVAYEQFKEINLYSVDPEACVKSFNLRYTGNYTKNVNPFDIATKSNSTIKQIDFSIDGFEFEHLSKELLLTNGFYDIEVTKASGDYGADIIAYKNDIKYAIQCKKYSNSVGVDAIQEVMGSKSIYNCHVAVVLTNNFFTTNAKKLASANNVLLWDRNKLKELLENYEKNAIKQG